MPQLCLGVPTRARNARMSVLARLGSVVAGSAIAAATLTVAAPSAHAASLTTDTASTSRTAGHSSQDSTTRQRSRAEVFHNKAHHVLNVASRQKGDPYRYGAAGPNAFDCSGLVYYTFRKALGRTLPRTANDQKRASDRIWHRRNLRPGDLVFSVDGGGYAYHVGIYAGHGYFWNAPHSGSHVMKEKMYGGHWAYGRVIKS